MATATRRKTFFFEDPNHIQTCKRPDLMRAQEEGRLAQKQFKLRSAQKTIEAGEGTHNVIIDLEADFADDGRLPVSGTYADAGRIIKRMVDQAMVGQLAGITVTIDLHPPVNIHSNNWWLTEEGAYPDVSLPRQMKLVDPSARFPFLVLNPDGTEYQVGGKVVQVRPRLMRDWTVGTYAPHLQQTGQGNIWVFTAHCHIGTDGTNLLGAFVEALTFVSHAVDLQPQYMFKGQIPQTDWFGPFEPCIPIPDHPQGGLQTAYLDAIAKAARVEIFGEAADFCVKAGMQQMVKYYGNQAGRSMLERVHFVTDCTSPIVSDTLIPGYTPNADFRDQMAAEGVQMITHDSPLA